MNIQNIRLTGIVLAVGVLLLVPMIARFPWSPTDFVIAGVLLLGTGLACEFVLRKVKNLVPRIAICAGILAVLFVIWAELAVGLIGTPFAGN